MDKGKLIEIVKWQNEDEMTEESMYDALYPLSKVNIVRLFPKEIIVKKLSSKIARPVDCENCKKLNKLIDDYDKTVTLLRRELKERG